jgi:transcriptional regulator with XRE-family HTH domain
MNLTQGLIMRLVRMGKGMSLTQLSEITGRSISYLSNMEHDNRDVIPEVWKILGHENIENFWYAHIIDALKEHTNNPEDVICSLNKALFIAASPGPLGKI